MTQTEPNRTYTPGQDDAAGQRTDRPGEQREHAQAGSDDHRNLLRIYLGDHVAGAAAGCRLARRVADSEHDGADGMTLDALARDIADDRVAILAIVDTLELTPNRFKQALAWLAERLGRLKLNGRVLRRSPLSTVVELELLLMGVRGKLAGAQTLRGALGTSHVGDIDLDGLIVRAEAQLETLAAIHARAARSALGSAPAQ